MGASIAEKSKPFYNPVMLRWARKLAGVSVAKAAKRASVTEEQVVEWERDKPTKAPTVRQARNLADLYKRGEH